MIILVMFSVLVLVAIALIARDVQATAQERDLQSSCPGGLVEWGDADNPKFVSVHLSRPEVRVRWATGVLGCERRHAGDAR